MKTASSGRNGQWCAAQLRIYKESSRPGNTNVTYSLTNKKGEFRLFQINLNGTNFLKKNLSFFFKKLEKIPKNEENIYSLINSLVSKLCFCQIILCHLIA